MDLISVPLRTTINLEKSVFAVGSEVNIPCEVEGYPIPRVLWYHEENLIPENGPRHRVLGKLINQYFFPMIHSGCVHIYM